MINKVDLWKVYTLADAFAPREPVKYAVAGLFELPSLSIVYGAPGTLKSFWLADLVMDVAAGLPYLPPLPGDVALPFKTTQTPVIWLDFDNGKRRTHERFEALAKVRGLPADLPLFYYVMPSPWLDAGSVDAMGDLGDRVLSKHAGVIVIDNLGVITGKADENSAEMVQVLSNLRQLPERTGAATIIIHHQRKGTGFKSRAGESLRGHSSIEAAVDLALLVEREESSDLITVKSTKTRGVDVLPFGARFTFEHRPGTTELESARFFGMAVEDTHSTSAIERAIVETLADNRPLSQKALKDTVKKLLPEVGLNRIGSVANQMVSARRIKSTSGAHGARLYDL